MRAALGFLLLATPVVAAGLIDDGSESDRFWSRQQRVGPNADKFPDVSPRGQPQQGISLQSPDGSVTDLKKLGPPPILQLPSSAGGPAPTAQRAPQKREASYVRGLLNYDIAEECRKGIYAMGDAIARGDVIPSRDIPRCVSNDSAALSYLDERWNGLPQRDREGCLAAFGSGSGKGMMMRYHILATCVGRPLQ